MEKDINNFIKEKLCKYRERFLKLLRSSNNSEQIEFASTWEMLGTIPSSFVDLYAFKKDDEYQVNEYFFKTYLALMQFQGANEALNNNQFIMALDELFKIEAFLVSEEVAPLISAARGRSGGKGRHKKNAAEKALARRFYRENGLDKLTNKAAAEILIKQCAVELRTAELYAAEFKLLGKATDQYIAGLSSVFLPSRSGLTEPNDNSCTTEADRAFIESRLAELKAKILDRGTL